jgi:membrane-associated phospholipid phosphatase
MMFIDVNRIFRKPGNENYLTAKYKNAFLNSNLKNFILIFALFIRSAVNSYGQTTGSNKYFPLGTRDTLTLSKQIVPIALMTGGILLFPSKISLRIQNSLPDTHTKIENYLQFAPIIILYSTDLTNLKHRNTAFNQTKYLAISELITGFIVLNLKRVTDVGRPSLEVHSFPSGHSAQSFVGATVLYKELKDFNKPIAFSGYLFSTATAALRVTNNKHWVSDVLFGSGLGIIVTNLVYNIEPLKNWDPFHSNNKISLLPEIDPDSRMYLLNFRISL